MEKKICIKNSCGKIYTPENGENDKSAATSTEIIENKV